jgi:hypothetical protein
VGFCGSIASAVTTHGLGLTVVDPLDQCVRCGHARRRNSENHKFAAPKFRGRGKENKRMKNTINQRSWAIDDSVLSDSHFCERQFGVS